MLIRREVTSTGALMGIWKMEETTEELLSLFPERLKNDAILYLRSIRSKRRSTEWLSTRIMLFELLDDQKTIGNHDDGKPYIVDSPYNISISHTKEYAAILLHKTLQVGIDIEIRSERVRKIANRFISKNEYIDSSQKALHQLLHWSAKESLFKLMDERGIDFRDHLFVKPFTPSENGIITAIEFRTSQSQEFKINYEVHPEYVLTWVADNQHKS